MKLIRNRKKLFMAEGAERTDAWKKEKKRVDGIIRERKRAYTYGHTEGQLTGT